MSGPGVTAAARLAAKVYRLPPGERAAALGHLARLRADLATQPGRRGATAQATRDPKRRRAYAGDPWAYAADIFGLTLAPDQGAIFDACERHDRALFPSGNGTGKTLSLGAYGLYLFDAVAALPDDDEGLPEQGCRLLLPGPDHETIFRTIYAQMLVLASRAEARGHLMPGTRSERSVLWAVRPMWDMEALSPPKQVGQAVAHTASGRHHRNQHALIEEGQGVQEALWRAAEGMCSSEGNKILSPFNPTEPVGPAYQRARTGVYAVLHIDAFNHPNVRERRGVIPAAVSATSVDRRVRSDCQDRGPFPATPLSAEHGDFVYALPGDGAPVTPGRRADGVMGDRTGAPRVYRPNNAFQAQVRGQWSTGSEASLFSAAALEQAMARWREGRDPDVRAAPPDRVGADPARMGDDDPCAAPAWGDTAAALLRRYVAAQAQGPAAVADLLARGRTRVGAVRVLPKGDGPDVALSLAVAFPRSPFVVDEGGSGASPVDHLSRVLRRDVTPVSFGGAPQTPIGPERWSENTRTQLYVRAALLVALGLVDPPDDPLLREELLAHSVIPTYRTAVVCEITHADGRVEKVYGELSLTPARATVRRFKERVPSVALIAKDDVKKTIGRSPDRADAFVLALHHDPTPRKRRPSVRVSHSYQSV